MQFSITNKQTGETIGLGGSCTDTHPEWVHRQMGTSSESGLQRTCDQMHFDDWFDAQGRYLGDCPEGVGILGLAARYIYRWEAGLDDQQADDAKRTAIAAAPGPLDGCVWKTEIDEEGVFLVMREN